MTVPSSRSVRSVARITGGLSLGGATVGAVCGPVAEVVWAAIGARDLPHGLSGYELFFAAELGAILGLIITPLLFWGLLRHVSFGRALAIGVPATVLGALIGDTLKPSVVHEGWVDGPILGAVIGFGVAAVGLRLASWKRRPLPDDDGV